MFTYSDTLAVGCIVYTVTETDDRIIPFTF